MTNEKYEEIIENLKLEKYKWITLTEFDSIVLSNGVGIYPNWQHMRFLLSDNEIIVKHGSSEPYGARLGYRFSLAIDGSSIQFPADSIVAPSNYYTNFRKPQAGDIIRTTSGINKIVSECMISNVCNAYNGFSIDVVNPIKFPKDGRLSFYDPKQYDEKTCIHGTEAEGIYMKFKENDGKNKKYGIQH